MSGDTKLKAMYEDTIRKYEFPESWVQSREFGLDIMRQASKLGATDLLEALEELMAAWPSDSLPPHALCMKAANAINNAKK